MADYGVLCLDEFGNEIFNTLTNAGRGLNVLMVTASGSITDPVLAQGIPWVAWTPENVETPRRCTVTITGTTLSYVVETAGMSVPQLATAIRIMYGVR